MGDAERLPHDAIVFVGDGHKALFCGTTAMRSFPPWLLNVYSWTTIRQLTSKALTAQAASSNVRQQIDAAVWRRPTGTK